jgi:hypothetical protein
MKHPLFILFYRYIFSPQQESYLKIVHLLMGAEVIFYIGEHNMFINVSYESKTSTLW